MISARRWRRFYRQIPLPDDIDTEQAQASYRDGVLIVRFPKTRARSNTRQIPVTTQGTDQQHTMERQQTTGRQHTTERAAWSTTPTTRSGRRPRPHGDVADPHDSGSVPLIREL